MLDKVKFFCRKVRPCGSYVYYYACVVQSFAVQYLFSINHLSTSLTSGFSVGEDLDTIHPNVIDADRNFLRLGNGGLVAYRFRIE